MYEKYIKAKAINLLTPAICAARLLSKTEEGIEVVPEHQKEKLPKEMSNGFGQ